MASNQELINALQNIKSSSTELSAMAAKASGSLKTQAGHIVALTKPSQSGQMAAMAVGVAANSLAQAAASMKSLSGSCEKFINNILK